MISPRERFFFVLFACLSLTRSLDAFSFSFLSGFQIQAPAPFISVNAEPSSPQPVSVQVNGGAKGQPSQQAQAPPSSSTPKKVVASIPQPLPDSKSQSAIKSSNASSSSSAQRSVSSKTEAKKTGQNQYVSYNQALHAQVDGESQIANNSSNDSDDWKIKARESFHVDARELPLLSSDLQNLQSYAGHIEISKEHGHKMFFWYFPPTVPKPERNDTLILWLQGGPVCSSLFGLFREYTGPFFPTDDNEGLRKNPYSWTNLAHVLYVDQPAAAGFSYMANQSFYPKSSEQIAAHLVSFLLKFYDIFPEMKQKRLVLAGESYAGMFLPYIAKALLEHNQLNAKSSSSHPLWIPLGGLSMNNPLFDLETQFSSYVPYLDEVDFFKGEPLSTRQKFQKLQQTCTADVIKTGKPAACNNFTESLRQHPYETRKCFNPFDIRQKSDCNVEDGFRYYAYLNHPSVKKALHIEGKKQWRTCNNEVKSMISSKEESRPSVEILPSLAKAIPIQIYVGDQDFMCNYVGVEASLAQLDWNGEKGFNNQCGPWLENGSQVGNACSRANLRYARVFNASHLVPKDQPVLTYKLMQNVLSMTA